MARSSKEGSSIKIEANIECKQCRCSYFLKSFGVSFIFMLNLAKKIWLRIKWLCHHPIPIWSIHTSYIHTSRTQVPTYLYKCRKPSPIAHVWRGMCARVRALIAWNDQHSSWCTHFECHRHRKRVAKIPNSWAIARAPQIRWSGRRSPYAWFAIREIFI